MRALRILIAGGDEVARRGIRAILDARPDWSICGEAQTGLEAVERAATLLPDVVLVDVGMPGLNGLADVRQIHRDLPGMSVVVLAVHDSEEMMNEFAEAGVRGYVLKGHASRNLVSAIDTVSSGQTFLSRTLRQDSVVSDRADDAALASSVLTPREQQVLRSLAEGRSNKEVGGLFAISVKTVETHRARIMKKLQLHSMNELVRYAIRHRVIDA